MRTGKRFTRGAAVCISLVICLAGLLANPLDSQAAGAYAILHNFAGGATDGFQPYFGGPVLAGETLYGVTQGGPRKWPDYWYSGTLYKINADGSGYQILHDFGSGDDGTDPKGSLAILGSTLYGFTLNGGGANGGTVFKINTGGSGYQVLRRFSTADEQCNPYGPPLISGARLYGLHSSGGMGGALKGAIFRLNLEGGDYLVMHDFAGKPDDGDTPHGALTQVGSRLYGMTAWGGHNGISTGGAGNGVIFAIDTDGNNYQVLHHFGDVPNDGGHPYGSLTLVGSKLYGMTSEGGPLGGGVLFSINPDGGGYQVLFDFKSVSLAGPRGSLTLREGKLYGMASQGGEDGDSGGIFRINPDGTGCQVLHFFSPNNGDGGQPLGDVTFAGSRLYGWTYGGGTFGVGVVFSYLIPETPRSVPPMLELLLLQ